MEGHAPDLGFLVYDGLRQDKVDTDVHIARMRGVDVVLTTYTVLQAETHYSKEVPYSLRSLGGGVRDTGTPSPGPGASAGPSRGLLHHEPFFFSEAGQNRWLSTMDEREIAVMSIDDTYVGETVRERKERKERATRGE